MSNKRKKSSKTSSSYKRESTIYQFLSKDKDSCTSGQAETATESQGNHFTEDKDQITDGAVHMMETDIDELANNAEEDDYGGSGLRMNKSQNPETITEQITEISDITQGTVTEHNHGETERNAVRISKVFNPSVSISADETRSAGSVTLISVDQVHEIRQQELAVTQLGSTVSEKRSPVIDIVHDKIRYQSGSDMDESFLPSASFVSQAGSGSPVINTEMNDKLKVGLKKVTHLLSKSPKLDVVSGIAYSPIFSRKKSENITQENVFGDVEKFQTSDINGESDSYSNLKHSSSEIARGGKENEPKGKLQNFSDSDIDTGINEPNQVNNTNKTRRGNTRLKRKLPNFSDSDGNAGINEPGPSNKNKENSSQSQTNSQENKRLKRNLPDFSDSGSDDNDLPLISRKTRPPGSDDNDLPSISRKTRPPSKKKFVSLDEMNKKAKKFSISKSFFSGKDEKLQPTLSFFMSKYRIFEKKPFSDNYIIPFFLQKTIICYVIKYTQKE